MYQQRGTKSGTIKRALLALPAAGLLAAVLTLSPGASQADSGLCHQWHLAKNNSRLIAAGDIYRVCDDRLEVLIVEDEHRTVATYTFN